MYYSKEKELINSFGAYVSHLQENVRTKRIQVNCFMLKEAAVSEILSSCGEATGGGAGRYVNYLKNTVLPSVRISVRYR